jgi:uncharacterized membrane protein (DUF2068 family)
MVREPDTLGLRALAVFFVFGALASGLAGFTLLIPRTPLEVIWRLNPAGHRDLQTLGVWAGLLMATVSVACAGAARGLWIRARWGRGLAIVLLAVNLTGDVLAAIVRHDARILIGIPIGLALIAWLLSVRSTPLPVDTSHRVS